MYDEHDHQILSAQSTQPAIDNTGPDVLTVSQLNELARRLLEKNFTEIWLKGEVSRALVAASGHAYFTLKDEDATISCACFRSQLARSRCQPTDGIEVLARGRVSIYTAQGRYQFIVSYMEEAGEGALQRKFEALKKKLAEEGLFQSEHKKPLPVLPRRVGLITSESGAVVHDMITTFRKRFPAIALRLYPVSVQGATAVDEIVRAITLAEQRKDCDALILARGGGSLEDLMAFNDERVARAVFACDVPIVCGVGHEPDVSIADFVADYRAATPTAAAEALSPDRDEWLAGLTGYRHRLFTLTRDRLQNASQRVDLTRKRLIHPKTRLKELDRRLSDQKQRLARQLDRELVDRNRSLSTCRRRLMANSPDRQLHRIHQQLVGLGERLMRTTNNALLQRRERVAARSARLQTVSPLATLEREYSIVEKPIADRSGHRIVTDSTQVQPGEVLHARLASGRLQVTVDSTESD